MPIWVGDADNVDPHKKSAKDAIKQAQDLWDELDDIDKEQAMSTINRIIKMCDESPEAVRGAVNTMGAVVEMNHEIAKQVQEMGLNPVIEGPLIRRYWQNAMYAMVIHPQSHAVMHAGEHSHDNHD